MDEEEGTEVTIKRSIAFFILSIFLILTAGCETSKGVAKGMGYTMQGLGSTMAYTAKGATKDTKNLWHTILKLDNWMKENLW